jgi:hypothetical protein
MDMDGERVLTILYVSNFAELPRSVFIRTQIQTSGVIWGPYNHKLGDQRRYRNDLREAINDTNSHKAEALV